MQKSLKIITAVVFVFIGAAIFTVKTQANFSAENSETFINNSFAQKGTPAKTLYVNNCARCHGSDGRGDTQLGKLYGAPDLTAKNVKRTSRKRTANIIKNGDGSMPAFSKKLSTAEINSLVGYIKTL